MEARINEELRQYKLFKIQETEAKVRKYQKVYNNIKESVVVKFTKNSTSNLLRIVFGLLTATSFVFGLFLLLLSQDIISERLEFQLSSEDKEVAMVASIAIFGLAILFLS